MRGRLGGAGGDHALHSQASHGVDALAGAVAAERAPDLGEDVEGVVLAGVAERALGEVFLLDVAVLGDAQAGLGEGPSLVAPGDGPTDCRLRDLLEAAKWRSLPAEPPTSVGLLPVGLLLLRSDAPLHTIALRSASTGTTSAVL